MALYLETEHVDPEAPGALRHRAPNAVGETAAQRADRRSSASSAAVPVIDITEALLNSPVLGASPNPDMSDTASHVSSSDDANQSSRRPRVTRRNVASMWHQVPESTSNVHPTGRFGHSAVVAGDLMVLFGGRTSNEFFCDTWGYDFTTSSWAQMQCSGEIPSGRCGHTATIVKDRYMYVIAGCTGAASTACISDTAVLDLTERKWYSRPSAVPNLLTDDQQSAPYMPSSFFSNMRLPARKGHTTVNVKDSCLLVFGGSSGHVRHDDNFVWVHNVDTGRWSVLNCTGSAPSARMYHVAEINSRQDTMYVFGGKESVNGAFSCELYELILLESSHLHSSPHSAHGPHFGMWRSVSVDGSLRPGPRMCASSILRNDVLCVFLGGSHHYHEDCYEFDFTTRQWHMLEGTDVLMPCTRPTTVAHRNRIAMFGGGTSNNGFMDAVFEMTLEAPTLKELCRDWIQQRLPPSSATGTPLARPHAAISFHTPPSLPTTIVHNRQNHNSAARQLMAATEQAFRQLSLRNVSPPMGPQTLPRHDHAPHLSLSAPIRAPSAAPSPAYREDSFEAYTAGLPESLLEYLLQVE